jgi:hypothetical protein
VTLAMMRTLNTRFPDIAAVGMAGDTAREIRSVREPR